MGCDGWKIDEQEEREGDRNRIETFISCVHTGKK